MATAQYAVGGLLPNGATVASDTFNTDISGTTTETMIDSKGNAMVITVNGAGTPAANQTTITNKVNANLALLETFIGNNPNGAVLTAAQTNVLARMLVGLARFVLAEYTTPGGS